MQVRCSIFQDDYYRFGCVAVEVGAETITLQYDWGYAGKGGAPKRTYIDQYGAEFPIMKSLLIRQHQWKKIRYNARFAGGDTGHWYYEKYVANVALVDRLTTDIFLSSAPDEVYSQMADLW